MDPKGDEPLSGINQQQEPNILCFVMVNDTRDCESGGEIQQEENR